MGNVFKIVDVSVASVLSEYAAADKRDHIHRVRTRIPASFFTIPAGSTAPPAITVEGTLEGGPIGPQPMGRFNFELNLGFEAVSATTTTTTTTTTTKLATTTTRPSRVTQADTSRPNLRTTTNHV